MSKRTPSLRGFRKVCLFPDMRESFETFTSELTRRRVPYKTQIGAAGVTLFVRVEHHCIAATILAGLMANEMTAPAPGVVQ